VHLEYALSSNLYICHLPYTRKYKAVALTIGKRLKNNATSLYLISTLTHDVKQCIQFHWHHLPKKIDFLCVVGDGEVPHLQIEMWTFPPRIVWNALDSLPHLFIDCHCFPNCNNMFFSFQRLARFITIFLHVQQRQERHVVTRVIGGPREGQQREAMKRTSSVKTASSAVTC